MSWLVLVAVVDVQRLISFKTQSENITYYLFTIFFFFIASVSKNT